MYKCGEKKPEARAGKKALRPRVLGGKDKRMQTPEYWESRLEKMGLAMSAGTRDFISYGHDTNTLDFDGKRTWPQTGESQDTDWPASLT